MNLIEMARRSDREIKQVADLLAVDESFEWKGEPLSGKGDAEIIMADGSLTASISIADALKSWVLVLDESKYTTYRVLRREGDAELVLQELEPPEKVQDVSEKYERDQLLDVLQGCQKHRHGEHTLPSF